MSALLVYRNSTPEVMAWAADFKARAKAIADARVEWMDALYNAHGVPDDEQSRGGFTRGCTFSGMAWPKDMELPPGWFRPVKTPQLVRPRGNVKAGKTALAEMAKLDRPDARAELAPRFGMPKYVFSGSGLYSNGIRFEDDAVWVTWGESRIHDEKEMRASKPEEHGWVRVPLVEYIARFGEDAL